ncbi:hypothetical protein Pst134EA_019205 [Puccinia striiformis f. sp. tritici]|uniref:hypothetical protein n=1 Tax=Puccinia striiformis f. sp. tritici TaxID=168172 RepID=UPI002008CA7D|nr:hypothetical protein Pst134EA_019205 [Puccinia striiformis f. sp. tritici]KAH9459054.1 hypothetical protein Pst134EA_019205 [Puccinia striiformis f. sp. tritici]
MGIQVMYKNLHMGRRAFLPRGTPSSPSNTFDLHCSYLSGFAMLPTCNAFRSVYIALTAVTSIFFHASQVTAGQTARCGTGFRASDQTPGWYICQDDGFKKHKCPLTSCTQGNHPWKDFMFNGCTESGYNSPTGRVGINFHVKEFKADNTRRTVSATGVNGFYYDCTFDKPTDFNARRPTCTNCNPPSEDDD